MFKQDLSFEKVEKTEIKHKKNMDASKLSLFIC